VLTAQLIREFRDRGRGHWLPTSVSGEGVQLTEREFEVLTQLGQGKSTCEIATELGISDVTVRRHISALLRKLGVSDRQSAVRLLEGAGQPNAGS
jgi:DNA-binding NarL/FixJ family response regulator